MKVAWETAEKVVERRSQPSWRFADGKRAWVDLSPSQNHPGSWEILHRVLDLVKLRPCGLLGKAVPYSTDLLAASSQVPTLEKLLFSGRRTGGRYTSRYRFINSRNHY